MTKDQAVRYATKSRMMAFTDALVVEYTPMLVAQPKSALYVPLLSIPIRFVQHLFAVSRVCYTPIGRLSVR
jgi:hypothetical protein